MESKSEIQRMRETKVRKVGSGPHINEGGWSEEQACSHGRGRMGSVPSPKKVSKNVSMKDPAIRMHKRNKDGNLASFLDKHNPLQ